MDKPKKNRAAVALGRLGGIAVAKIRSAAEYAELGRKGGRSRARNLSKERLSEIGRMGGRPKTKLDKQVGQI